MPAQGERFLKIKQIKEITQYSNAKCYAMCGTVWPVVRAGRTVRVPAEAFDRWLKGCVSEPATAVTSELPEQVIAA